MALRIGYDASMVTAAAKRAKDGPQAGRCSSILLQDRSLKRSLHPTFAVSSPRKNQVSSGDLDRALRQWSREHASPGLMLAQSANDLLFREPQSLQLSVLVKAGL
jgi:hypothetical protein